MNQTPLKVDVGQVTSTGAIMQFVPGDTISEDVLPDNVDILELQMVLKDVILQLLDRKIIEPTENSINFINK